MIEAKFHMTPLQDGEKKFVYLVYFTWPRWPPFPYILLGLQYYKVFTNAVPGLTMIYFTAGSIFSHRLLNRKSLKSAFFCCCCEKQKNMHFLLLRCIWNLIILLESYFMMSAEDEWTQVSYRTNGPLVLLQVLRPRIQEYFSLKM